MKFNMINFAITHNADERKVGYAVGLFCGVMYVFMCVNWLFIGVNRLFCGVMYVFMCVNRLFIGVNRLFCGVMYVYLRLYSPMNTFSKACLNCYC